MPMSHKNYVLLKKELFCSQIKIDSHFDSDRHAVCVQQASRIQLKLPTQIQVRLFSWKDYA